MCVLSVLCVAGFVGGDVAGFLVSFFSLSVACGFSCFGLLGLLGLGGFGCLGVWLVCGLYVFFGFVVCFLWLFVDCEFRFWFVC